MKFALTVAFPLAVHCWDDECVLFNPSSGDTHRLSWSSIEVLKRLGQAPCSPDDLADFFLPDHAQRGPAGNDASTTELATMLADLEHLALVERIS